MVSHLVSSRTSILSCPIERELGDVEKVLVSVAQRLDEGMYPSDQVTISRHYYPQRPTTHRVV